MGLHRVDPIRLRCRIWIHEWVRVNKVRYNDTPEGKVHLIFKCSECKHFKTKTVNR